MKSFNINGGCSPKLHYMVNLDARLQAIGNMVQKGQYFTINRARQYGKTTTLQALEKYLQKDYTVISLDFQLLSSGDFENEYTFVEAFSEELLSSKTEDFPEEIKSELRGFAGGRENARLSRLFRCLSRWCAGADKKIVLMIDEVDSAANNQVFLDFLAQLRGYYIQRDKRAAFQSVILTGVYDIKNLKRKFAGEDERKVNSPWNIAADFLVDMDFSKEDIRGMLEEYEQDYKTGMDTWGMAGLIYEYTSGYPFLVSKLCKVIDEQIPGGPDYPDKRSSWTKNGFLEAVKILLAEKNTLLESLIGKLEAYPELKSVLYSLLFCGQDIAYNPDDGLMDMALMFGFIKKEGEKIAVVNRIFETRIYNYFLTTTQMQNTELYKAGLKNKNQFVVNGHLDMYKVLERFVLHFDELYGDRDETFYEEDGRKFFLLYLKPIINGAGNYYIESRTRNMERTDIIIDYQGEQIIIELKIWRGNAYHTRGEKQLLDYLEHYHLQKGYMLSFNFNKKKQIGVKEIKLKDCVLVEAVV